MRRHRTRSTVRRSKSLSGRLQALGTIALAVTGTAMTALELWAAWFASTWTLTVIVLVGGFLCIVAAGMCWLSGNSSGTHVVVGAVSLIFGAGCAYILKDASSFKSIGGTVGVLLFSLGGALVLSGRADLDYPGL